MSHPTTENITVENPMGMYMGVKMIQHGISEKKKQDCKRKCGSSKSCFENCLKR